MRERSSSVLEHRLRSAETQMPQSGRSQPAPAPRTPRGSGSKRKKGLLRVDKGQAQERTLQLKSKILIAAAEPLARSGVRRPQPVETLFAVSRAVGSRMDVTEVLRHTTRELVRALAADFGSVWGVSPDDQEMTPVAGFRVPIRVNSARASKAIASQLLMKTPPDVCSAVYSSDSAKDPRFNHPLLRLLPHRSVLIQPLRIRGDIKGVLAFVWTRSRHRFTDIELRLVDAVTLQAANAIENAELLGEVVVAHA